LMDWPRLEKEGFGRLTATAPLADENRITDADGLNGSDGKPPYSGFFSLTPADFPKTFPRRPSGKFLYLRREDEPKKKEGEPPPEWLRESGAKERWGGIVWTSEEAKAIPKEKGLDFKGIIKELQTDIQFLGYSIDINGEFDDKTEHAVRHMIYHTFSGDRRG